MVKRIFLTLDDGDFEKLKSLKGSLTWEQFLVEPLIRETEGVPYRKTPTEVKE